MDLVEQVHIFGLSNIHTFEPNISLIRPFSLILNYAKPRLADLAGVPGIPPSHGTQFFRFHIHFHQKAPASEVDVPPNSSTPPTGKTGSATTWAFKWNILFSLFTTSAAKYQTAVL